MKDARLGRTEAGAVCLSEAFSALAEAAAVCGWLLASDRVLVAAETRICERVRAAVSDAKSVSRMTDSAAELFSS